MTKKTMGTLMFINRHKDLLNKDTRIIVVQTLVLSIIKYGLTIWGKTNTSLMNKVLKIQNFAIKVADGKAKKYDHVTPLFKELQWLRIKDLVTFHVAVKVFNQKSKYFPDHILSLPTVNTMNDSTTRQQNNLFVPTKNTDMEARAIYVLGPRVGNQLPKQIKDSHNLSKLKSKLNKELLISDFFSCAARNVCRLS